MDPNDWRRVIDLGLGLAQGSELAPHEELRALLLRMAPQVALSETDAQQALTTPAGTAALVREIHRRTREGSYRLGRAFKASDALKAEGDIAGARRALEEALAAEVVPLYRDQLRAVMDAVDAPDDV
ncbi:DUF2379 family protein [Corallococcus sp. BB11-1]|uniref:DUSAM domain-containing protein n=1 Tax=Corallococcus sp. BB11-1 TaxID=2996783 RepID=UPI0010D9523F|nr:DUF2379 family protein [Corallococcus sp. BB11-1]MCY1030383.1 DUF2379 family protein [Corallococcus sp. BB11-1]RYZ37657.1 MAG: DUF2379 domain-containing protein [Myxococcaceae bacterium]